MTQLGFTLDDILDSLEKKAAEDDKDKKEKGDKAPPFAKKEDGDDDEDKKEKGKKEGEQEKSAAFKSGSELAKEVMEKIASQQTPQTTNKGEQMNKQASEAGKALAQALLKKAGVGDVSTSNGITDGVVPNKGQVDLAAQVAEHAATIQPTPGTDGMGNGGTINQIFDAIVNDALARGVKDENVTGNTAQAEGARGAQAPNQVPVTHNGVGDDSQEKSAAVSQLVNDGFDFDQAVTMVKAAADQIEAEEDAIMKQAALAEMLEQGMSFSDAVNMIKTASVKNSLEQEKQAALTGLLEAGMDFNTAVDLVEAKAAELYSK